jgi:hypothetical protein
MMKSTYSAARQELVLPPLYSLVSLRERGDAHAHACAIASEAGAGTLVRVRRFDIAEFAVVLEPGEPLVTARRAFLCGMAALADALSGLAPPEKPISFDWPGGIRCDGARIGGARLAWPEHVKEKEEPDWLVFSVMINISRNLTDPGLHPYSTSLEEEGFEDVYADMVVEGFSRHLMAHFDGWTAKGFRGVAEAYLERLPRKRPGERRSFDPSGDLLVKASASGRVERFGLLQPLLAADWLDPETGEPRL